MSESKLPAPVAEYLEAELGRPVVSELIAHDQIRHVNVGELDRLRTAGPLAHRLIWLRDSAAPHRPVATSRELVAVELLPASVAAGLDRSGEPIDRLLTRHGVAWRGELISGEGLVAPIRQASCDLSWADTSGVLVELVRLLSIERGAVAVVIDEVPLWARAPVAASA